MSLEPTPLPDRIRAALRLEPLSNTELKKLLGVGAISLERAISVLHGQGAIQRLSDGSAWINAVKPVGRPHA